MEVHVDAQVETSSERSRRIGRQTDTETNDNDGTAVVTQRSPEVAQACLQVGRSPGLVRRKLYQTPFCSYSTFCTGTL